MKAGRRRGQPSEEAKKDLIEENKEHPYTRFQKSAIENPILQRVQSCSITTHKGYGSLAQLVKNPWCYE